MSDDDGEKAARESSPNGPSIKSPGLRRLVFGILRESTWARWAILTGIITAILYFPICDSELRPGQQLALVAAAISAAVLAIPLAAMRLRRLFSDDHRQISSDGQAWIERTEEERRREQRVSRRKQFGEFLEGARALAVLAAFVSALGYGGYWLFEAARDKVNAWRAETALGACKKNLEEDLAEVLGVLKDPTVVKCVGRPKNATCFVRTLVDGAYKTEPVVGNCSTRHMQTGIREKAKLSSKARETYAAQSAAFFAAIHDAK